MKTIINITGLTLIVLFYYSCKPMQVVSKYNSKPLPATYGDNSDTSAIVNWKSFFSDKYLTALIDSSLQNNWDVQMALQRIQAAQTDVLVSRSMLRPNVTAGAAAGLRKFGLYTMDGAGNKGTPIYDGGTVPEHLPDYFVGLQSTWEVDLWGKLKNQKKAAMARFLSSMEGKNLVITGLIAEIATSYYELLALDQTMKILNETVAIQENAYRLVKVQKEAAVVNELAVKQFEAQLLNLKAAQKEALLQITQTESWINFLTGRYPQYINRDTTGLMNVLPMSVTPGIPAALLQNRPDIRQAELELVAAKADVQSAKAAFYPSLNITGSLGFQAYKTKLLFTTPESFAYGILGSLAAPIVNRAAIKATFNRAGAVQLEVLYNYQKAIANGYVEVYNEWVQSKNLQEIFDIKSQEANALTQSISIAEKLFKTGRANYLEVLLVQQNALQARLQLIETRKNQFFTSINMYKALGGGWR